MSPRPLPATGRAAVEDELLAQLGLPPSASPEDVDQLHEAVSEFLAAAPSSVRGWARAQVSALDAAYLQLTDPVGLEGSALRSPASPPAVVPGGPATPPARRGSTVVVAPVVAEIADDDDLDDDDLDDEDDAGEGIDAAADEATATDADPDAEPDADELAALYASVTPSAHTDMGPSSRPRTKRERREARRLAAASAAPMMAAPPAGPNIWKRLFLGSVALVAVVGIALGANALVNGMGAGAPAPTDVAQATQAAPAVDMAKIATLMQKLQANPSDVESLLALGDEYYFGNQFDDANGFYQKVIAIDPKNVKALNAIGAVYYNKQDLPNAEKTWKAVVVIDPKNTEAHFNLGFLYLNQPTADMASMQREWNIVIALDPNSQFGQVAQAHLDSLAKASMIPAPSAGASGAPASSPAASPAASAGASPAASPVASPAAGIVNQTALNLAYGTAQLAAPAGTAFTLHFDNQESGLPHDIQIKDASGNLVFKGDMVTGPRAVDYAVPALAAGSYTFSCSIHPNMTGTLKVGA